MTSQAIPSLLQNTLTELESKRMPKGPLFFEVGSSVVPIAIERCKQLSQMVSRHSPIVAKEPKILLLLSQENLEATFKEGSKLDCNHFICLSEENNPKEDLRPLDARTRVLATTPQRAIDHLRRDNILLEGTEAVVLAYHFELLEEESSEQLRVREQLFLDDCRFIFTKLSEEVSIELYADSFSNLARTPQELVSNPRLISRDEWERPAHPLTLICCSSHTTESVVDTLYALQQHPYLLIFNSAQLLKAVSKELKNPLYPLEVNSIVYNKLGEFTVPPSSQIETVVTIGLDSEQLLNTIRHLNEWKHQFSQIVGLVDEKVAHQITTSKETLFMNNETKTMVETTEVLGGKIQMLVAKLNIDDRPDEIEELKKIIKKNVPFYRRGHFSAYLLRELMTLTDKKSTPRAAPSKPSTTQRQQPAQPKKRSVPSDARTLYLNIGKMRRLYAKELSQILQDRLEITKDEIYSLRIHDKYSFITLSQENADKALEKLQGVEIRGRVASISYSNKE